MITKNMTPEEIIKYLKEKQTCSKFFNRNLKTIERWFKLNKKRLIRAVPMYFPLIKNRIDNNDYILCGVSGKFGMSLCVYLRVDTDLYLIDILSKDGAIDVDRISNVHVCLITNHFIERFKERYEDYNPDRTFIENFTRIRTDEEKLQGVISFMDAIYKYRKIGDRYLCITSKTLIGDRDMYLIYKTFYDDTKLTSKQRQLLNESEAIAACH